MLVSELKIPEGKGNTCLIVSEAELLSPTNELPHCLDEDGDGPRAHEHFRVQFNVQLTWCSIK